MSWIVALAYLSMAGLLIATWRYRRFLLTPSPIDLAYHPKVALLMGVRGVDPELAAHVESLFRLDYPDYEIVFAVAEADDPAAPLLAGGCARHPGRGRVVVIGLPWTCSQNIHNVLGAYAAISDGAEIVVVVDADVELHPLFLRRMVTPLADAGVGATTGYRWLVPTSPTLARIVATMTNAAGAVSFRILERSFHV